MIKYNVKIVVPILNKTYEVFVPSNILVGNMLYMLINSIKELTNVNIDNALLYDSTNGEIIDLDSYVYVFINNGSKLILV